MWLLGSFAEVLTKRALAERVYADLGADGAPVTSAQLVTAAGLSPSDARAQVVGLHMATADHGRSP